MDNIGPREQRTLSRETEGRTEGAAVYALHKAVTPKKGPQKWTFFTVFEPLIHTSW